MSRSSQCSKLEHHLSNAETSGPAPAFTGADISNQADTIAAGAITPINTSLLFSVYGNGGLTQYSANNLPVGLLINKDTGVISGSPTVVGVRSCRVTLRTYGGFANSDDFTWTITAS